MVLNSYQNIKFRKTVLNTECLCVAKQETCHMRFCKFYFIIVLNYCVTGGTNKNSVGVAIHSFVHMPQLSNQLLRDVRH